jgi:hypothetical protein
MPWEKMKGRKEGRKTFRELNEGSVVWCVSKESNENVSSMCIIKEEIECTK